MDEHEIRARLKEIGRCKSATELIEPYPLNSSYNEIARTAFLRFGKGKTKEETNMANITDADRTTVFTLLRRGVSQTEISKITGMAKTTIVSISATASAVESGNIDSLLNLSNETLVLYKPAIEWAYRFFQLEIPAVLAEKVAQARRWKTEKNAATREKQKSNQDQSGNPKEVQKAETSEASGLAVGLKVINDSVNRVSGGLTDLYTLMKKNEAAADIESAIQVGFRLLSDQMKQQHEVMLNTIRTLAQDKKSADNANSDAAFAKLKSIEEKVESCKIAARRVAQG